MAPSAGTEVSLEVPNAKDDLEFKVGQAKMVKDELRGEIFPCSMEKQIQPVQQHQRLTRTRATHNGLVGAGIHLNSVLLGRREA